MDSPQRYLGDYSEDRDLIELIEGMIQFKTEDRYSIDKVLTHPWLHKLPIATPEEA